MINKKEDYKNELRKGKKVSMRVEKEFERKIVERFMIKKEMKRHTVNFISNFEPVKEMDKVEQKMGAVNDKTDDWNLKGVDDLEEKINLILNAALDKNSIANGT